MSVEDGDDLRLTREVIAPGEGRPAGDAGEVLVAMQPLSGADGSAVAALDPRAPPPGVVNPHGVPVLIFRLRVGEGRCLWLFGSRARGDHRTASDCDLMVLVRSGTWRERRAGRLSLSLIPQSAFRSMVLAGEPFAHEVLGDARHLAGNSRTLARLQRLALATPVRHDPAAVAAFALALSRPGIAARHPELVASRLRWCLRSLLLADGHSVFGRGTDGGAAEGTIAAALDRVEAARLDRRGGIGAALPFVHAALAGRVPDAVAAALPDDPLAFSAYFRDRNLGFAATTFEFLAHRADGALT